MPENDFYFSAFINFFLSTLRAQKIAENSWSFWVIQQAGAHVMHRESPKKH